MYLRWICFTLSTWNVGVHAPGLEKAVGNALDKNELSNVHEESEC